MAASYKTLGTVIDDPAFRARVDYAMMTAAINVAAEGTVVANHVTRMTFAQTIFSGSYSARRAALAILTNPTIAAELNLSTPDTYGVPDADIQFAANSVFNALAGIG